jgi:hypothetical protein
MRRLPARAILTAALTLMIVAVFWPPHGLVSLVIVICVIVCLSANGWPAVRCVSEFVCGTLVGIGFVFVDAVEPFFYSLSGSTVDYVHWNIAIGVLVGWSIGRSVARIAEEVREHGREQIETMPKLGLSAHVHLLCGLLAIVGGFLILKAYKYWSFLDEIEYVDDAHWVVSFGVLVSWLLAMLFVRIAKRVAK